MSSLINAIYKLEEEKYTQTGKKKKKKAIENQLLRGKNQCRANFHVFSGFPVARGNQDTVVNWRKFKREGDGV